MGNKANCKIDFVVTWVDGSDPAWQADKNQYSPDGGDARESRFRDWDQLRYWFRAIEKYAPWVNKIHFVTYGHLPEWLDTSHPKLNIVNHKDFIPEEFLPVFNSTAIEIHLHRIPGLSEQFVYFNDDFYLMQPTKPEDFFVNGLPADEGIFVSPIAHGDEMYFYHLYNDYSVYSIYFDKKRFFKNIFKYMNFKFARKNLFQILAKNKYVRPVHHPKSFLKSTFEFLWADQGERLNETARSRFRRVTDNSPELFRGYQVITGNFSPALKRKYSVVADTRKSDKACQAIESNEYKYFCLSDNTETCDFEDAKRTINASFEKVFPQKSSFEK